METVLYPGRGRLMLLAFVCLVGARGASGWVSFICMLAALAYGVCLIPGAGWLRLTSAGNSRPFSCADSLNKAVSGDKLAYFYPFCQPQ